jgi:hypothetical protein
MNGLEALAEVRLYSFWFLDLGQNFKEFFIGQEEESICGRMRCKRKNEEEKEKDTVGMTLSWLRDRYSVLFESFQGLCCLLPNSQARICPMKWSLGLAENMSLS